MGRKKQESRKGGARKKGRNIAKCANYKSLGKRERNKRRKVSKHLRRHPNDRDAIKSI